MTVREQLAYNLAHFRQAAGHSQKSAAQALETKPTTISSWERGVSQPSADMLVRIAMAYRVTLSDLCGTDYRQEFTNDEKRLVFAYRRADEAERIVIRRILGIEEKKESLRA